MRTETLLEVPEFEPVVMSFGEDMLRYEQARREYQRLRKIWDAAEDKTGLRRPRVPRGPDHHRRPGGLYNGMIAPLLPYAIRGAIWYQGEANAGRAYEYRSIFPAMIRDWRESWGQGDFPFLFVQLPNFRAIVPEPSESDWAELREAQAMTLSLPNTEMAVTIDLGEANNIHPTNKQDVGKRLSLTARAKVYGEHIVYTGPRYQSMVIDNGNARIRFRYIGGGLKAAGAVKGFAIAGPDRIFVWAEATIDGEEVVVWNEQVPNPVAVRYAWANNPVCNLSNAEGFPAAPFRTDDWSGVTIRPE
jgi:sialate O-acetylesterase